MGSTKSGVTFVHIWTACNCMLAGPDLTTFASGQTWGDSRQVRGALVQLLGWSRPAKMCRKMGPHAADAHVRRVNCTWSGTRTRIYTHTCTVHAGGCTLVTQPGVVTDAGPTTAITRGSRKAGPSVRAPYKYILRRAWCGVPRLTHNSQRPVAHGTRAGVACAHTFATTRGVAHAPPEFRRWPTPIRIAGCRIDPTTPLRALIWTESGAFRPTRPVDFDFGSRLSPSGCMGHVLCFWRGAIKTRLAQRSH